jgi:hypothetical protein
MRRRTTIALALAALAQLTPPAFPASACDFGNGFRSLHELMPETVGGCLTDERADAATGDTTQQTTGGLLVWRRADNVPAFTDGYHTWLLGPRGLEHRLASERLPWETTTPPAPPPLAVQPVHLSGVSLSDFRVGRDDPRYSADLPYLSFSIENRHTAPVPITDTRLEYSAVFVDATGTVRYPSTLASLDALPPEGLLPGSRTRVLLYALMPSTAPFAPTAVELYHGRGLDRPRELLRTFPLP